MRILPETTLKDKSNKHSNVRIQRFTKILAIGFILLIQLAIIYKMLF